MNGSSPGDTKIRESMGEPFSAEAILSGLCGMADGDNNPKIVVPAADGKLHLSKMPFQGR